MSPMELDYRRHPFCAGIASGETRCGLFVNVVRLSKRERLQWKGRADFILRYRAAKTNRPWNTEWAFDEYVTGAQLVAWLSDKQPAPLLEEAA